MRIIRRGLYAIITLTLLAAFFIPRPIFKPDWISTLTVAIEAEECDQIQKIYWLAWDGNLPGIFTQRAKLNEKAICGFKWDREEIIAWKGKFDPVSELETAKRLDKRDRDWFLQEILYSSYFSTAYWWGYFALMFDEISSFSEFQQYAQIQPSCARLGRQLRVPTYRYMQYALANPLVDTAELYQMIKRERQLCAMKARALANYFVSKQSEPAYSSTIWSLWRVVELFHYDDQRLIYELMLWEELETRLARDCEAEADEACKYISFRSLPSRYCSLTYPLSQEAAILCAQQTSYKSSENVYVESLLPEATGYYFSLLANDLERDIDPLIKEKRSLVSQECAAIIEKARKSDGDAPWDKDALDLHFFRLIDEASCEAKEAPDQSETDNQEKSGESN